MAPLRTFTGSALLLSLVCIIAPAWAQQLSADLNAALSEADSLASLLDSLELAKCRAGLPSKLPCPGMPPSFCQHQLLMLTPGSSAQVLLHPRYILPAPSRPFPCPPSLHRRPFPHPQHQPPSTATQASSLELCDPLKLFDRIHSLQVLKICSQIQNLTTWAHPATARRWMTGIIYPAQPIPLIVT